MTQHYEQNDIETALAASALKDVPTPYLVAALTARGAVERASVSRVVNPSTHPLGDGLMGAIEDQMAEEIGAFLGSRSLFRETTRSAEQHGPGAFEHRLEVWVLRPPVAPENPDPVHPRPFLPAFPPNIDAAQLMALRDEITDRVAKASGIPDALMGGKR